MFIFYNVFKKYYFLKFFFYILYGGSRVHPWKLNLGLNSYWLGGPEKDGDGTVTGGFIYADISSILEKDESGLEEKAWFTTEAISPTSARGRCIQFDFSLEGLNVKALRLKIVTSWRRV